MSLDERNLYVPQPVAESNRSLKLKEYLRQWANDVVDVKKAHPEVLQGITFGFYFLSFYWLTPPEQHNVAYRQKHSLIESSGFDGERIKAELEEVLSEDAHLRECCDTTLNLAYHVDWEFIYMIVALTEDNKLTDETYEKLFSTFAETTYSQPFRKLTLSHLYNFHSPDRLLRFNGIQVMRLEPSEILDVIGDVSVYNFLHNHQTGEFFAITESLGGESDIVKWLFSERAIAIEFMGILQYYKDGIVDIDYTAPFFLPEWVNRLRKRGLSFVGDPRRVPFGNASRFYELSQEEAAEVNRWWQFYQTPQVVSRLANLQNKLRQALLRAGVYYEASMEQKDAVARMINLAISLESLFSPSDKGGLSYRISLYASLLVSADSNERVENFKFLREMYKRRSALFHGTYDTDKDLLTTEEAERLAGIIRISILRFFVLYMKGEDKRDNILDRMSDGVLNPLLIEQMRIESDPHTFIEAFQLPAG